MAASKRRPLVEAPHQWRCMIPWLVWPRATRVMAMPRTTSISMERFFASGGKATVVVNDGVLLAAMSKEPALGPALGSAVCAALLRLRCRLLTPTPP